jgi:hypothetical protein
MILIKLNQYSASPQPLAPYKFIENMRTRNIPDPNVLMSITLDIMMEYTLQAQSGTLSVQNFMTRGIAMIYKHVLSDCHYKDIQLGRRGKTVPTSSKYTRSQLSADMSIMYILFTYCNNDRPTSLHTMEHVSICILA